MQFRKDVPWLTKTAAYTPIVVLGFGTKLVLTVAAVEIKVAHPKLGTHCQHHAADASGRGEPNSSGHSDLA